MPRKQIKPPIKLRKRYAALIELCRDKILTSPSQTSGTAAGDAPITATVKWPTKQGTQGRLVPDIPEDFPTGVYVERCDEYVVIRHSVVALLSYFQAKGYITYTAATLFATRLPILMRLAKMELGLERSVDLLQHVEQELLADNGDSVYNDRIG